MKTYHNVTSRYSASLYNVLSLVYQMALLSHRPVLLSVTYIFIKQVRILLHIGGQEVCRCPNKKHIIPWCSGASQTSTNFSVHVKNATLSVMTSYFFQL